MSYPITQPRQERELMRTAILGALLVGVALHGSVARADTAAPQTPSYQSSLYVGGTIARQVTVKTRSGDVLTVLDVPIGIELSIHVIKGSTSNDERTGNAVFTGDITIRTMPTSQMVNGGALDNMLRAPLKLDVQDA